MNTVLMVFYSVERDGGRTVRLAHLKIRENYFLENF